MPARLAIEHASVKSRATEGEADLRWIDARCQIADCLTKHTSRKSEEVLQQVISQAKRWTTAEETMLEIRREERERGQKGFVSKRVRAEYTEATFGGMRILKFVHCLTCPERNSHVRD